MANVARHMDEVYQPRMHDLRHTFAVHRLTSWYEEGENVLVLLPALATYMGYVGMNVMERYLSLTPAHYRQQVTELSGPLKKKRTPQRSGPMCGVPDSSSLASVLCQLEERRSALQAQLEQISNALSVLNGIGVAWKACVI